MSPATRASAGLLALLAAAAAGGDDPVRLFEWRRAVEPALEAGRLYRAAVPPDAFGRCRDFPRDLRVVAGDGALCPFYVYRPASTVRVEALAAEPLNRSRLEGTMPVERVDLRLTDPGPGRRHDRVRIVTDGGSYLRRVEVFGSDDGTAWAALARGYLARDEGGVRNDTIGYPASTYPRLRIHVFADARNVDAPFAVYAAHAERRSGEPAPLEPVPLAPVPDPGPVGRDTQAFAFDTGHAALPVDRLEIEADDAEFDRPVRVYGRDAADAPWRLLACGSVWRLGAQAQREVELGGARARYLRVELRHFDDAPLANVCVAAAAVPWVLVCEGRGAPAALYYGSEFAAAARFDLEQRRGPAEAAGAEALRWGEAGRNPAYRPQRVEASRVASVAAVAVAALVVLAVVVSMLRRQPAAPS